MIAPAHGRGGIPGDVPGTWYSVNGAGGYLSEEMEAGFNGGLQ